MLLPSIDDLRRHSIAVADDQTSTLSYKYGLTKRRYSVDPIFNPPKRTEFDADTTVTSLSNLQSTRQRYLAAKKEISPLHKDLAKLPKDQQ